jgi:hypothetical protein
MPVALAIAGASQFAALEVALWGFARALQPQRIGGLMASMALGALVVGRVRSKAGRVAFAVVAAVVLVSQLGYFRYYHAQLDAQVVLAARFSWADVEPVLVAAAPQLALAVAGVSAAQFGMLTLAAPLAVGRPLLAGLALVGGVVAGSPRQLTAEIRAVHALAALMTEKEANAAALRPELPAIESQRERLPDVLLVIAESVRAADACQQHACTTGHELHRALPDAVVLSRARSLASYTALALSALMTGRPNGRPAEELAADPDLFDLARAIRANRSRYEIRYWSAQLPGALGRSPLNSVADEVIDAETLLGRKTSTISDSIVAGLDRRIADRCEQARGETQRPRLIIVHFAGTHTPYFFDEEDAPFEPWQRKPTWAGMHRLHNAYLNALREQDRSAARCVRAFLAGVTSRPWIVMYTSDHGEAFGEHHAIHHGQNLYDEQIRVPWIIAHGRGALTARQAQALRAARTRPVTHADLLPTLLDAWGILDHFALQGFVRQMPGRSLLRRLEPHPPMPITNCTETFRCPLNTWGVLGTDRKLIAQAWDGAWRCLRLEGGEREVDRGECSALIETACEVYSTLPCGDKNWPCRR